MAETKQEVKRCSECKAEKPFTSFGLDRCAANGRRSFCLSCSSVVRKRYYNSEKRSADTKRWRAKKGPGYADAWKAKSTEYKNGLRAKVVSAYGGRCTCCGEDEPLFLTLEHLNGDGRQHRKIRAYQSIFLDIIKAGFPDSFTILCINCNMGKFRNKGICPHKTKTN